MSVDRLIIEKAVITAGDGVTKVDISATLTDMVIYEHIDKPYLTGSVSFMDTEGVFNKIQFKGLEEFSFAAKFPEDSGPTISRKFVIDATVDTSKNNDNSELVTVHFVEEIAFISSFLNVNKSYTGSSREIVEKIMLDSFTNVELSAEDDKEAKYDMQVVVPNMTPLGAANWIKDRTTSTSGTPYYLFSTLGQPGKMHFMSLATMIEAPAVNPKEYRYSQSTTQRAVESRDPEAQYHDIKNYEQIPLNISDLINKGLISSQQGWWDTSVSGDAGTQFEIENTISQVPSFNRNNFKFKNEYMYKDGKLNTIQSRKQYSIHSSYPYSEHKSFRELENLNRAMTSKAIRRILTTGALNIAVSGRKFIVAGKNRTIGNSINIRFLDNEDAAKSAGIDEMTDKVKSGKHMIYAVRHNISLERYNVTLTCTKLENLP
jgi:hypothetical protein